MYTHEKRSPTYVKVPVVHSVDDRKTEITQHALKNVRVFRMLKLDTTWKQRAKARALHWRCIENQKSNCAFRVQQLCESRGGRPGLPSLISLRFLWT